MSESNRPLSIQRLLDDAVERLSPDDTEGRQRLALQLLDALLAWHKAGGELIFKSRTTPADDTSTRGIIKSILDGMILSDSDGVEVLRLHATIRASDQWRGLPRDQMRAVVALCTARLRRLQDDKRLIHPRLEGCFTLLTAFSKREQPGYVTGLSRHHRPVRGSWKEDAEIWWTRLTAIASGATSAEQMANPAE